ncbi:hypothetical protein [Paludisphaera mucosa]|uniref:Ascorbate-dependent monooxygenase n=1 Tax=Paludisphaera mucosa TaxID=3030827 RepID=A0ABT6F423_9BACT|nr:hypothetical protein [Paludisphaera mucosa]MDG3002311.1 hypothetical protein [Paludisphaera mucosa]
MAVRFARSAAFIVGCTTTLAAVAQPPAAAPAVAPAPTYRKDVRAILQARCVNCHRKDNVAPFALETYEQARKRAHDLAAVAEARTMPPWKANPRFGPPLKHDPTLSEAEIETLRLWADADSPEGEGADETAAAPAPTQGAWSLGEPDVVLEMLEEFVVPASGSDLYRCFVIPSRLSHDVYISAVEYQPGNRRVVHHLMAFIDLQGNGRERDKAEEGPGYTSYSGAGVPIDGDLGGFAAGNQVVHLPEGVGRLVPRGSDVILQVHYHPTGKREVDRTRIGLHLCRKPVEQSIHWANATNDKLRLPAGDPNVEVKAAWHVPIDVEALGVTPHMHQLGRDFRMTATLPDGTVRELIDVPHWDPAWQSTYYFQDRIPLPKGSTVQVVAHFDNSAHPLNPNSPPKVITWGPAASDEMLVGYIGVVKKGQDLTRSGEKDDLFQILARQYVRKFNRERYARR